MRRKREKAAEEGKEKVTKYYRKREVMVAWELQ